MNFSVYYYREKYDSGFTGGYVYFYILHEFRAVVSFLK